MYYSLITLLSSLRERRISALTRTTKVQTFKIVSKNEGVSNDTENFDDCRRNGCIDGHNSLRRLRANRAIDPNSSKRFPRHSRSGGCRRSSLRWRGGRVHTQPHNRSAPDHERRTDAEPGRIHQCNRGQLHAHSADERVMAIAFMANSQHLFSRSDILADAGIDAPPSTYGELVTAAKAIREAGIMEYPLVMNMQTGWNVGESFNLVFLAHGGAFFEPGTANPTVDSAAGVAALETLKELVEYAHPDHLTQASNETQALWEAGEAALGIMWGSRGAAVLDDEGSTEDVTSNTVLSAAPSVEPGGIPGATLWWDGFTISSNVSDEEAAATFAALTSALTPEMVAANNDDAVWLLDGFVPGAAAAGVSETAQAGAAPYPMLPQIGLMHNALGAELSDFLQGNETAEEALADVVAAYTTAAKEAGFLK